MKKETEEIIEELEIKVDMMNESDLKGELTDEELEELSQLKIELEKMKEETNGL